MTSPLISCCEFWRRWACRQNFNSRKPREGREKRQGPEFVPCFSLIFPRQRARSKRREVAEDILNARFFLFCRQLQVLLDARGDVLQLASVGVGREMLKQH